MSLKEAKPNWIRKRQESCLRVTGFFWTIKADVKIRALDERWARKL